MTIPIDQEQKDFFVNVYDVVKCIPLGRVTSYGAIAKYLGAPSASRTVGWAMNSSHKFSEIPAHRVVNRNGMLTGKMHFKTPKSMQKKLEKEGVMIINDKVHNFKDIYWDPNIELKL